MPHGETRMHSHHEIDVITLMVDGNIKHEGSMECGKDLSRNDVQVQRAGGDGFSHNEINPDGNWNRLIQRWALPEVAGQSVSYKVYNPVKGELTRIYGGENNSGVDFPSKTKIDVALQSNGQQVEVDGPFLFYISRGKGIANNKSVQDGDLIRGNSINFEANEDAQIIVIHTG
jgi:redox-sensitive bicupin YhaK (pirin superfamily)